MVDRSEHEGSPAEVDPDEPPVTTSIKLQRLVLGAPKDLKDRKLFHHLALIPFLAWVGLGADGLSSSAYGPEAAYKAIHGHSYLAVGLALLTVITVLVISSAYSLILEKFPHGGGGYLVSSKLLGKGAGVVSGCALLVDYILTITVSMAAAGDALFSLAPPEWQGYKFSVEVALILGLTVVNMRGAKESVMLLTPIFMIFVITHMILIGGSLITHAKEIGPTAHEVSAGFSHGLSTLGVGGMVLMLIRAYSLGGGTYTGIEAVSNGLPIIREPRVQNGKRTMVYMAVSLAVTAAGLLICYLLWHVEPLFEENAPTMNALLVRKFTEGVPGGKIFEWLTLISEGAILAVAAQAGMLDGPRVLGNMAVDSWMPHSFAALSERLTTRNGIAIMGIFSLLALWKTDGKVDHLVVMYSINVFLTFSLSMYAMSRYWWRARANRPHWKRRLAIFGVGFVLCATVLCVTIVEKFAEGGWVTLVATGSVIVVCFMIHRHYQAVSKKLADLYVDLADPPPISTEPVPPLDHQLPTAVVLVGSYGGLGIHTVLNIFRSFPKHYKNLVFVSVGVIDSGGFKGESGLDALKHRTESLLKKYATLSDKLGVPSTWRMAIGTEAVFEAERLCLDVAREFPQSTFFAGQVVFRGERWYHRLLHNKTAFAVQKGLQWAGKTMVILPARIA